MLNNFFRVIDYIQYLFESSYASNIEDPNVKIYLKALLKKELSPTLHSLIEETRSEMLRSQAQISFRDLGGGNRSGLRFLSSIVRKTAKPYKYGKWLHQLISFHQPQFALELGSGSGISAMYQASAMPLDGIFISLEGDETLSKICAYNCSKINRNIEVIQGNFDHTLPQIISTIPRIDYAFIDGNHQYDPTLSYFEQLLQKTHHASLMVVDDINWSLEMQNAWSVLKKHPKVMASIDIFAMGMLYFDPTMHKTHIKVRY